MDTKMVVVGSVGIRVEEAREGGIREGSHEVTRESHAKVYEDYYLRMATISTQALIGMTDEAGQHHGDHSIAVGRTIGLGYRLWAAYLAGKRMGV